MNKFYLTDKRLSPEDKGIIAYLVYRYEKDVNYKFSTNDIIEFNKCGKAKTRRILDNIEEFGYIKRRQTKLDNGKFNLTEWSISEFIY